MARVYAGVHCESCEAGPVCAGGRARGHRPSLTRLTACPAALDPARAPSVRPSRGGNNSLGCAPPSPERITPLALADTAPTTVPLPADRINAISDPPLKDSAETFLVEAMARNPKRD